MLATTLDYDPYLGRVLTGLIHSGVARLNMPVKSLSRDGRVIEQARLTKLQAYRGLDRRPIEEARAGDIIAVAGLAQTTVADTICAPEVTTPLAADPIDPPTLAITFSVNDSPLAGREGTKVTSRMIGERLFREAEGNVAIRVSESAEKDAFEVAGRGELQLGVLIETMRREGLRTVDLAAASVVHDRSGDGPAARADRRGRRRRRRGIRRRRRRQDEPPQGGNAGDAALGRRQACG